LKLFPAFTTHFFYCFLNASGPKSCYSNWHKKELKQIVSSGLNASTKYITSSNSFSFMN
jgi:hypothetical protein